jgi:hypothetical protein
VLLDPILHEAERCRTFPRWAYTRHTISSELRAMAQLAAHRVETHRGPAIERLQPRRGEGVAEHPGAELTRFPAGPHREWVRVES